MIRPTEKKFTADIMGIGEFTFKYTTLLDEIKIDNQLAAFLKGNERPSLSAENIAAMISTLMVAVVKSPEDFDLNEIVNYDELKAVYDAYSEKVNPFRRREGNTKTGAA